MDEMPEPLAFEPFVAFVETELGLRLPRPADALILGIDVELDSVRMLELVVAIEDLGAMLPVDVFLSAPPMRELHANYLAVLDEADDRDLDPTMPAPAHPAP
ncbi:MAG TPA: hypothetical protein VFB78_02395 [Acidimicrobiales bacterium]|nr:hypothetical protein [Acidimicrobiales bacterium]